MKLQLSFNFIKDHSLYAILTSVLSLAIALLSSILFSASFGNDTFVRIVCLIIVFSLFEAVFIMSLQAWDGLCDLFFKPKALPPDNTQKEETAMEEETEKEVVVQKSLPTVQTEEEHTQACLRRQEDADEKKRKILDNIYEYAKEILSTFFDVDNINLLCEQVQKWADDPTYEPAEVKVKKDISLSTNDYRHIIWNIGVRLKEISRAYTLDCQVAFGKRLFKGPLEGLSDGTFRNLTQTSISDRIALDRTHPDDKTCMFEYQRKQQKEVTEETDNAQQNP